MGQRINPILFRLSQSRKWKNSTFQYNYPTFLKQSLKLTQLITNFNKPIEIKATHLSSSKNSISYSATAPIQSNSKWEKKLSLLSHLPNFKLNYQPSLKVLNLPIFNPKFLLEIFASNPDLFLISKIVPSSSILGIKLQLKGRIKGIAKAKRITYIKGKLPLQKIKAKIDYCSLPVKTTHGIIGTQLWIYYNSFR